MPPPAAIVVLPAPVAVAPRGWRRQGIPPAVVMVPTTPSRGSPAPAPVAASAKPLPAATPTPAATADVEHIPAPLPAATTGGESLAFSSGWYARHPDAWRPARAPADWWKAADAASVSAWLGQPVVRAGGAADPGQVANAGAAAVGADGLRSVLVLQSGLGPEAAGSDWLPLGVFAVAPPGGGSAHNYQQLAIDRSGVIRGNFYDAISDAVLPITGSVDRDTLRASWTVGANGSRFEAAVAAFSASPGMVTMSSGSGSRDLELVRIHGP